VTEQRDPSASVRTEGAIPRRVLIAAPLSPTTFRPFDRETDFLVVDRSPEADNCEEVMIAGRHPIEIVLDPASMA
jgi:hypothetical protein